MITEHFLHRLHFIIVLQDEFGQALEEDPEEPSLLARILPACVREVLKCRDEDVAEILESNLATRDTGQAEETCEILESEEVKEFLTRDDQAEVEDALKHKQFTQEEQASLKRAIRRLRGGGSSGSGSKDAASKGKRRPITFLSDDGVTMEQATKLLPPGFRPYKDQFNKCWRAFHTRSNFSVSRSWGYTGKDSHAVRKMCSVAWVHHISLNPQAVCPWDFNDAK